MADQPTALQLADWAASYNTTMHNKTAAELRRLHDLLGTANALCRIRAAEIERLNAEKAELLETLRRIATVNAMDYEYQAWARAAIAKAEAQQ